MEITGRITADAQIKTTKNGSQLVAFTIVVNDSYKTKEGEIKNAATFINCSFWKTTKIAEYIIKGGIVTVSGRIDLNAYKAANNEFYAHLIFHCDSIKLHTSGKYSVPVTAENTADLPF